MHQNAVNGNGTNYVSIYPYCLCRKISVLPYLLAPNIFTQTNGTSEH